MLGYATPQHLVFGSPARFEVGRGYLFRKLKTRVTMNTQTAIAPTVTAPSSFLHRIWAPTMIFCAFGINAAWIALLGYGLFTFIEPLL